MKNNNNELDVDFIGGQGPLTESEEKTLNEFFKKKKAIQHAKIVRKTLSKNKKEPA